VPTSQPANQPPSQPAAHLSHPRFCRDLSAVCCLALLLEPCHQASEISCAPSHRLFSMVRRCLLPARWQMYVESRCEQHSLLSLASRPTCLPPILPACLTYRVYTCFTAASASSADAARSRAARSSMETAPASCTSAASRARCSSAAPTLSASACHRVRGGTRTKLRCGKGCV
jgi:hypothetical protein